MKLMFGDCLERMKEIEDKSVDMICCDLPYGKTANKWDKIISFEKLWDCYKKISKNNAAIVLFGMEPFSSKLRISNIKDYKYDWVWQKDKATNFLNSKKQPMRRNENILVFYKRQCVYNPQLAKKDIKNIRPATTKRKQIDSYGNMTKESKRKIPLNMSYPNETLIFRGCFGDKGKSYLQTQKPVDLLEYLIKTYTNKGDLVLDNCMGSGSTGIACINTGRKFIGIEKNKKNFLIAKKRILKRLEEVKK